MLPLQASAADDFLFEKREIQAQQDDDDQRDGDDLHSHQIDRIAAHEIARLRFETIPASGTTILDPERVFDDVALTAIRALQQHASFQQLVPAGRASRWQIAQFRFGIAYPDQMTVVELARSGIRLRRLGHGYLQTCHRLSTMDTLTGSNSAAAMTTDMAFHAHLMDIA